MGLILFFWIGCQTISKPHPPRHQEEGLDKLIKSFLGNKSLQGKSIGVGDFANAQGEVDSYARGIANKIEVEISKAASQGQFQVINRQNFVQLAKEWELNLSGAVDPSSAKKVGSLLGVDVLLTGNTSEISEGVEIAVKALDTETGKILWAESTKATKAKEVGNVEKKEMKPPKEGEIKIQLWSDRPSYKIGESTTFHFKTNRDCYVTIIDAGTSGKVHILYPNRFSGGNKVIAGKTYSIPGKEDGYTIKVSGPGGIEVVRAIATETPLPFVESDFSWTQGVFRGVSNPVSLTRDLNIAATQTEPANRGEGLIRVEIKE